MALPTLFPDISPVDELLETYFLGNDCNVIRIENEPLDELASEEGDMESSQLLWPKLSIDFDAPSFEPQTAHPEQSSSQKITEEDLINLPIQDLNKRLRRLPKPEARELRKRRRSLKNRGYATNCRQRRAALKESLQAQNQRLKDQLREIKQSLNETMEDRDSYKKKWESLQRFYQL